LAKVVGIRRRYILDALIEEIAERISRRLIANGRIGQIRELADRQSAAIDSFEDVAFEKNPPAIRRTSHEIGDEIG
jgi:hypothetical protein